MGSPAPESSAPTPGYMRSKTEPWARHTIYMGACSGTAHGYLEVHEGKGGLVGLLVFPRGEQAQLVRLANETA